MSTQEESSEPTNEQLANFLVVYAASIPQLQGFELNPVILEMQLENPIFREAGLKHYRAFQKDMNKHFVQMKKGELQCEYIRPNGKKCPNHNEPGSFYCGLHKEEV